MLLLLKASGHIILAILVFFSSTGLVLSKHFCRQELKGMALLVSVGSCHAGDAREAAGSAYPAHAKFGTVQPEEHPCCQDKAQYIKPVNEQPKSLDVDALPHLMPPAAATPCLLLGFQLPESGAHAQHLPNYKPPPLVCDRTVMLQTFRL